MYIKYSTEDLVHIFKMLILILFCNFGLDLSFNVLGDIGIVRFSRLNCCVVE